MYYLLVKLYQYDTSLKIAFFYTSFKERFSIGDGLLFHLLQESLLCSYKHYQVTSLGHLSRSFHATSYISLC